MSLSPQEINHVAVEPGETEDAETVGGHCYAHSAQRRVLLHCSLVGLIGIAILVSIIAGHVPVPISSVLRD